MGFCDDPGKGGERATRNSTFSIPCESWGSATLPRPWPPCPPDGLSVFPANRGVLRPVVGVGETDLGLLFQYSLRIVGFCDVAELGLDLKVKPVFQYSLRIVGFCDDPADRGGGGPDHLSVFPANRGVLRHDMYEDPRGRYRVDFQYSLRIVGFCDKR